MIDWDKITTEDSSKISLIVSKVGQHLDGRIKDCLGDPVDIRMDLHACHINGCPLDLDKLLSFDRFNMLHDVIGISRHMNRDDGTLQDHFRPRSASPEVPA